MSVCGVDPTFEYFDCFFFGFEPLTSPPPLPVTCRVFTLLPVAPRPACSDDFLGLDFAGSFETFECL